MADRDRKAQLSALWGMLFRQSRISPKNIRVAREWADAGDPQVAPLAAIVSEIGVLYPGRRQRRSRVQANHPALWQRMVIAGIVEEWAEDETGVQNQTWKNDEDCKLPDQGQNRGSAICKDEDEEIPF